MKIYSFSILHSTFDEFAGKLPYVVAIVEDETGHRQAAFVDGYREGMAIEVGQTVEFTGKTETGSLLCRFV